MERSTLKYLRLIVPGAIIIASLLLFRGVIGAGFFVPELSIAEVGKSLVALVLGVIYYATPLRPWMLRREMAQVQENLRAGLVRVSGLPDRPETYTWQALRSLFYPLVDGDASLTAKAKLAYHNGLIWTSLADVRAISLVFFVLALATIPANADHVPAKLLIFPILFLVATLLSRTVTRQHLDIGDQQIEIIRARYAHQVVDHLRAL